MILYFKDIFCILEEKIGPLTLKSKKRIKQLFSKYEFKNSLTQTNCIYQRPREIPSKM